MVSPVAQSPKVLGQLVTIVLGGKTWQARCTTMGDLADFEGHLRGLNVQNFLNIADQRNMDPTLVAATLDRLYNTAWTPEEKARQSQSVSGMRFFLYSAMKPYNETLTMQDVADMVTIDCMQEVIAACRIIQKDDKTPEEPATPKDPDGNPTQVQQ